MKKYIKTFKIPPISLQAKIRNGVRIDLNNENINIEKSTYRNDEVKIRITKDDKNRKTTAYFD